MRNLLGALGAAGLVMAGAGSARAHHSIPGEFDTSRDVEITGAVVEYKLISPHTYLLVETESESGETETWTVTYGPASKLIRGRGWSEESVAVGDIVTARGMPAREYTGLYMRYFAKQDGEVLLDVVEVDD